MIVGIPKEIKPQEHRVALTPAGAHRLVQAGHGVLVQEGAGMGSGFSDQDYTQAGARLAPTPQQVFAQAELVVKVKEPLPQEVAMLRPQQWLFTYLHLAPQPQLTRGLMASGATAVAYETVQRADGTLPLLVPMSEVAGRMAIQVGAWALEKHAGGRGVLLGGIPGVRPGKVVIIGGGVVGTHAAQMAVGLGADVVLMDIRPERLAALDLAFHGRLKTLVSNAYTLAEELAQADLVVGAVLVTGAETPHLVSRAMVAAMQPGSVIVDVDIDQGGCVETSRPTTHDHPTFVEEGVVHYGVTNMPGAVARTSTFGLTNATLPYILALASGGQDALAQDPALAAGVNVRDGRVVHPAVARAMGLTP
ncbi:MAG: alanine dehydrogenase [Deltaproteobacteria bacterium]|nr:alanine dehydrogenase [Deltaproteobacteria bacterium]